MTKSVLRRVKEYFYFPTRLKMLSYIAANTVLITKLCEVVEAQKERETSRSAEFIQQAKITYGLCDRVFKLTGEIDNLNKEVRKLKRGKK